MTAPLGVVTGVWRLPTPPDHTWMWCWQHLAVHNGYTHHIKVKWDVWHKWTVPKQEEDINYCNTRTYGVQSPLWSSGQLHAVFRLGASAHSSSFEKLCMFSITVPLNHEMSFSVFQCICAHPDVSQRDQLSCFGQRPVFPSLPSTLYPFVILMIRFYCHWSHLHVTMKSGFCIDLGGSVSHSRTHLI